MAASTYRSARASQNRIKLKSSTGKVVSQLEAPFSCDRFIWLDQEAKVEACRGGREVLTATVADFGPGSELPSEPLFLVHGGTYLRIFMVV